MTSFVRTNSGLTNLSLFHSVDVVIFTEGGSNSLSPAEVSAGSQNSAPEDSRFWSQVLKINRFKKTYVLKPIGSKTAVLQIAAKIVAGEVHNIAAAMDRDLDDFFGIQLHSPLVLYTRGYSWEADVFTKQLTKEQIASFLFSHSLAPEVERDIETAYREFEKAGGRIARLEFIFRSQGIALISEARGERFFRKDNRGILDIKNLKSLINERKGQLRRPATCSFARNSLIDPYVANCGKLLRALSCAIISYVVSKYGRIRSFQGDLISAIMLERFGNSDNHVKSRYYSEAVNQLNAALSKS